MGRQEILEKLSVNKPKAEAKLPVIPSFEDKTVDLVDSFHKALLNNNATIVRAKYEDSLSQIIDSQYPLLKRSISTVPEFEGSAAINLDMKPNGYDDIELVVAIGEVAVAENGAIWVSDHLMPVRILPFITQYLVLVVDALNIVPKMHQAYKKIDPEKIGFGVFISGPSKTGDIEQALVIGAHGSLGLMVIIRE
ncbi:MAG: LUD domain-containing protein [Bacteroidetes bacterium]|nr:LUD domain-containing protein [Bacteroidota bacterium]MDA1122210.1 LUD domain-containing protein [Bacteroidota bacterium]